MLMLDRINEWLSKFLVKIFGSRNERLIKEMLPIVQKINDLESSIKPLSDEELKGKTAEFQSAIRLVKH